MISRGVKSALMDASTDFSLVQHSSQHISKWGKGKGGLHTNTDRQMLPSSYHISFLFEIGIQGPRPYPSKNWGLHIWRAIYHFNIQGVQKWNAKLALIYGSWDSVLGCLFKIQSMLEHLVHNRFLYEYWSDMKRSCLNI